MSRFYLVDPSLYQPGGHHFQQGGLMAEAAARHGWEPIVAAHRFVKRRAWTAPGRLEALFRRGAYAGFSVTERMSPDRPRNPFARSGSSPASAHGGSSFSPATWRRRLKAWWKSRRALATARGLAASLDELFRRHPPSESDRIVMPTVTEFDLAGVVEHLARCKASQNTPWSLVFHFPLVIGPWTGDPVQLDRLQTMRDHFQSLAARVPDANLRWCTTTPELAEQYDRLGLGRFEVAPPPVRATSRSSSGDEPTPLRVVCAGGLRSTKMRRMLDELLGELESDDFLQGRLQIWVQAPNAKILSRWSGGREWRTVDPAGDGPPAGARRVHVPHPLPYAAYERLLGDAQIGLLAYQDPAYVVLHSGVLAECLASGLPAVVTKGTWMEAELQRAAGAGAGPSGLAGGAPRELAAALRAMATDYSTYAEQARRIAPAYARRHSPDALFERFLASPPARN